MQGGCCPRQRRSPPPPSQGAATTRDRQRQQTRGCGPLSAQRRAPMNKSSMRSSAMASRISKPSKKALIKSSARCSAPVSVVKGDVLISTAAGEGVSTATAVAAGIAAAAVAAARSGSMGSHNSRLHHTAPSRTCARARVHADHELQVLHDGLDDRLPALLQGRVAVRRHPQGPHLVAAASALQRSNDAGERRVRESVSAASQRSSGASSQRPARTTSGLSGANTGLVGADAASAPAPAPAPAASAPAPPAAAAPAPASSTSIAGSADDDARRLLPTPTSAIAAAKRASEVRRRAMRIAAIARALRRSRN